MPQIPKNTEALDVWLRFDPADDEEAEAEANVFPDGDGFRADWYLTAVGQVTSRPFPTHEAARSWLASEGFQDFTS
jgi:hypothetical protein